jgi:hypothetical protein
MLNDLKQLVGKQVLLHLMNDDPKTNPIPPNTKGTIISVDDLGYYKVQWENGRVLNLLPDEDEFEFLDN